MSNRNAVCLCADKNFLLPALFVADAVRKRQSARDNVYDVLVFTDPCDVTDAHRDWMQRNNIHHFDNLDTASFRDIAVLNNRLTKATLMKLRLAEHLDGRYDRLLYLDADLTIHDGIGRIFALDTGDFALAAVAAGRLWMDRKEAERIIAEDHFRALGMTPPFAYFNTGVVYIDIEKWNRIELGSRALDFIRRHPELCILPDEDALNATLNGDFAMLSPVWNMRPAGRFWGAIHDIARPVIIHHIGEDKPWRRYGYRKRLFADRSDYRLYESFLADTPWAGWLDEQWTWRDLHANLVWELRRVTRRLRGRPEDPTRANRDAFIEAFRRLCADSVFVDVDQGIVSREGGRLRLNEPAATDV